MTRTTRRPLMVLALLAAILAIVLAMIAPAQAAPVTIILKSGPGSAGSADPLNEVSSNGGATWQQATIVATNIAWAGGGSNHRDKLDILQLRSRQLLRPRHGNIRQDHAVQGRLYASAGL